jgi:Phage terminase large subunit
MNPGDIARHEALEIEKIDEELDHGGRPQNRWPEKGLSLDAAIQAAAEAGDKSMLEIVMEFARDESNPPGFRLEAAGKALPFCQLGIKSRSPHGQASAARCCGTMPRHWHSHSPACLRRAAALKVRPQGRRASYFFATAAVEACLMKRGTSVVCIREVQRVLAQSSKKLVDDTIRAHELEDQFEIQADRIKTPGGGLIIFNGMQDHTAESIKSLEGFDTAK